jgi:hypothetical protein
MAGAVQRWGMEWAYLDHGVELQAPATSFRMRLAAFRTLWEAALDQLARGLAYRFAASHALALQP